MVFLTTPIYALLVALVRLILWFRVSGMRSATGQSIGVGGDMALMLRVRQHGICQDWATFILILMMLGEGGGTPALYLNAAGILLVTGQVAHPFGLKIDNAAHPLRYVCNGTNILAALIMVICIAARVSRL
ncbi:MAPEG family protein [Ruegeria sp. B32]|uniref:MAPEG family protein n=1 Tax=Ruegeria sp. B32 TaxID=2867020 RepID=UPI0021A2F444|nr:MAPEG family protein [Ruegeria sp. B32]UWR07266.1 MAPEG family protein [Ruegeria sp. B32]